MSLTGRDFNAVSIFSPDGRGHLHCSGRRIASPILACRVTCTMACLVRSSLPVDAAHKNTQSLIGGVIQELEKEGMQFIDSTQLLEPLLAKAGVLTQRRPTRSESKDMEYGRPVAWEIARLDLGQTIVVKDQAVVAVETMEGTDETIRRASRLVQGGRLTVIKVSGPGQDMRFDVPVVGLDTLQVFQECNVSALSLDAGTTLILDCESFIQEADRQKMTIVAQ